MDPRARSASRWVNLGQSRRGPIGPPAGAAQAIGIAPMVPSGRAGARLTITGKMMSDGDDNRFFQGTGRDSASAAGEVPTHVGNALGGRRIRRGPLADAPQADTRTAPSCRMARIAR